MWVTPAYLRSALPTGQHIASTQANRSCAANASTCSRFNSGRMALTNPSFIGLPALHVCPAPCFVAANDGFAHGDLMMTVLDSCVKGRSGRLRGNGAIDRAEIHFERIGKTFDV